MVAVKGPIVHLDIEDVFAGAVGSVFGKFILFVVAVWLGCSVGAAGMAVGAMVDAGTWRHLNGFWIWASPLLLFSIWALLNIPFLLFFLIRFIRDEGDGFLAWGIVIGVESLVVMAGWAHVFVHGWRPLTCAWFAWLILLIMLETGIWLIRQHLLNCWARNLGMLRAENAMRRALKEEQERSRMLLEDDH